MCFFNLDFLNSMQNAWTSLVWYYLTSSVIWPNISQMFPSKILNRAAQALARSHALRMAPHWSLALHTSISFQGPMGRWVQLLYPLLLPWFLNPSFQGSCAIPKTKSSVWGWWQNCQVSGFRCYCWDRTGLRDVVHQLQKPLGNNEDIPPLEKEIIDSKVIWEGICYFPG